MSRTLAERTPYKDKMVSMKNFKLGGLTISSIRFDFRDKDGNRLPFKRKNLPKIVLYSSVWYFPAEGYDTLLKMFTAKYGEPDQVETKKIQPEQREAPVDSRTAYWKNTELGRQIILVEHDSLTESTAVFKPFKKQDTDIKKGVEQF